jgi:hypothetical protein
VVGLLIRWLGLEPVNVTVLGRLPDGETKVSCKITGAAKRDIDRYVQMMVVNDWLIDSIEVIPDGG